MTTTPTPYMRPDDTQGTASSAKTPAAPCHPAHSNAHEVTPS
ncbi:hypothetical protein ACWEN6_05860 [Sphaerisporangium sp. NPDC004334]